MSYTLAVGNDGTAATAQVVWSVDGKTYAFRSDNNFISWITTIFEVGDAASGIGSVDYRLLRPDPATSINPGVGNVSAGSGAGGSGAGQNNTCMGVSAGGNMGAALNNTLIGRRAGFFGTGVGFTSNVAVGRSALQNILGGTENVAVGDSAMLGTAGASGSYNTAVGGGSLRFVSTGANNTAIGKDSGNTLTGGSSNTILGTDADVDTGARTLCVVVGRGATSPAVDGSFAVGGTGGNLMGNLVAPSSGTAAGQDLIIYLNGARYLIALKT